MYIVINIFVLCLVYTTRAGLSVLERAHNLILGLRRRNRFVLTYKRNIRIQRIDCLFRNGFQLIDKGKAFLADENNSFSEIHYCSTFLSCGSEEIAKRFPREEELNLLYKDRKNI